jgi:DNA-binding transcriptional LysR family regulator
MNLHHLELFYYVAKNRGISAASRRMPYGIQQPAISGQLAQLEKTLGMQLFDRRPFGLRPAGEKLFFEIEPFFRSLPDLPAYIRGHTEKRLRLAAPVGFSATICPRFWRVTSASVPISSSFYTM